MVWAATLGLPLSLEGAGAVIGLEKQKLFEGKDLIRFFSMSCKPTQANGQRTRNLPIHAPDKWERFRTYNARDVETEMEIQRKLARFPVSDSEWLNYHLPSTISGRKIAMESISAAQLEPESVEEIDLSANGSVLGVAEHTVGIAVVIYASRGGVLIKDVKDSLLTARVMRGATDITDQFDASRFVWTRKSADTLGDITWNSNHRGTKSITVACVDVPMQANFTCEVEEE